MIIECDNCSTKFRLDDSKLGPRGVKVKCTKCQHLFIVRPEAPAEEPPEAPPEEEKIEFEFGEEGAPEDEGGEEEKPSISFGKEGGPEVEEEAPAEEEKLELGFETEGPEEPVEEETLSKESTERGLYLETPSKEEEEGGPEDFELGFEEEAPAEGEGEEPSISFGEEGGSAVEEETPEEEKLELGFETEGGTVEEEAPAEEFELGFEEETPPEPGPEEEPPGAAEGEEETITFSIGEEGERGEEGEAGPSEEPEAPPEPAPEPEPRSLFEHEFPEEAEEEDDEAIETLRKEGDGQKTSVLLYIVLVLVIAASGALLYLSGVVDKIIQEPAPFKVAGALEVEKLEGFFADNKHFGRVFALEGRIKNTSEDPQEIQAVKGVIYDKQGVQVSSRLVSPGRIVSKEELKTLPKEDILKHFKDLSAGFIPPKGTIPIMVIFTELPPGMAEAEVEVVR